MRILSDYAANFAPKKRGMVEKNLTRLRQFDLPANRKAFLKLPERVFRNTGSEHATTPSDALRVMLALAVRLLTVSALRADNLVGLEVNRHLVEHRRGRARVWHIVIPGENTKNGAPFEKALSEDTSRLLDTYLRIYRSQISASPGQWLFPGPTGRRSTVPFSSLITKFVQRETGIIMNVHLFRHLVSKFHGKLHPNDIETVRRILGHKSSATTLRSYTEHRADEAFRRYDETIATLTDEANRLPPKKPHGRRGGDRK